MYSHTSCTSVRTAGRRPSRCSTPEQVFDAVDALHKRCKGGYAVVALIVGFGIVAFRDPHGIRPLVLGERDSGDGPEYMVASESVALAKDIAYQSVVAALPQAVFAPGHDARSVLAAMLHDCQGIVQRLVGRLSANDSDYAAHASLHKIQVDFGLVSSSSDTIGNDSAVSSGVSMSKPFGVMILIQSATTSR